MPRPSGLDGRNGTLGARTVHRSQLPGLRWDMAHLPERKPLRLPGFDYSTPGAYFVSIGTLGKRCLFGRVVRGRVLLSAMGEIVEEEWRLTAERRPYLTLNAHVIMPNHVHGLIFIREHVQTVGRPACASGRQHSLSSIVGGFKAAASRRIAQLSEENRCAIWQRSYHEHVVRDSEKLDAIRAYIANNPTRWRSG